MIRVLFISLLFITINALGQNGITNEQLVELRKSFNSEKSNIVLQNAISGSELKPLALNRSNIGAVDQYFKYKVSTSGITDQESSGRCWLFTGLNMLRPFAAQNMGLSEIKLSQNYLFFYDQLEKANLFYEGIIENSSKPLDDKTVEWLLKNPIGDGGQWTGLVDLVKKYGVVPEDVMPETKHSSNTSAMSSIIATNLRANAMIIRSMAAEGKSVQKLREQKTKMLAEVYKILVYTLGEPPTEFVWRYKDKSGKLTDFIKYTPTSFYEKWINIDLSSYVMLMNDPSRPFYKVYEIQYDRHSWDGHNWKYINLPAEDIKKMALASIKANEALYFSCDVGKQLDMSRGYLDVNNYDYENLFGVNLTMNKVDRIRTFSSGSTHGMTLIGADTDENEKPVKWLLENSWGMKGHKGYLIMTDEWLSEYMFRLVVNKAYVPAEILKLLDSESILLPPWDPMFSDEL